jgi:WD40 repeat protein
MGFASHFGRRFETTEIAMLTRILVLPAILSVCLGTAQAQDKPEVFAQLGHSGSVASVAVSPDGKVLAAGSWDKTITFWDVAGRRELRTLNGHDDKVYAVAFSPSGKTLASGSADGTVRLWDVASGRELPSPGNPSSAVFAVAFSPDGQWLAAGRVDGTITVWDMVGAAAPRSFDGHCGVVTSLAFSGDRRTLAAGCQNGIVTLRDVTAGAAAPRTLDGRSGMILSVAFARDGHTLAFGSDDGTVAIWDIAKAGDPRIFPGHSAPVRAVAFSPDGQTLASGAQDNTVMLWDVASQRRTTLNAHNLITSVAFSPDGKMLAAGSADDDTIKLWDTDNLAGPPRERFLASLGGHSAKIRPVAFSPDDKTLAAGSGDWTVALWDVASGKVTRTLSGHFSDVYSLAFSPDGNTLASGSADRTVKLWDLVHGGNPRTLTGHADTVNAVAFSPDGQTLASASGDGTIMLWAATDANRDTPRTTLSPQAGAVYSVAFSRDGRTLAAGCGNGTIKLWDLVNGGEPRTLSGHTAQVSSVAFSRDGTKLASGGWDNTVRLWDLPGDGAPHTLGEHAMRVAGVAFSPDGSTVASGSEDTTIKLWNIAGGREPRTLRGHLSLVNAVTFADDGRTLASGSYDGTARLWDVPSGREKVSLDAFRDGSFLAIIPEGYYDASAAAAEDNLNIRFGNRVFPIASYRRLFYRPDLVELSLAGTPAASIGFPSIDSIKPVPPDIELIDPPPTTDQRTLTVSLRIADAGGGIGDVLVFVNGTAVPAVALPPPGNGPVTRSYAVQLANGPNTVRAEAYNAEGSEMSPTHIANVTANLPPAPQGKLHAIVLGIQEFKNPVDNLKFAVSDAALFAETLKQHSAPLFQGDPDITVLTTTAETTRDRVRRALAAMQTIKAGPDDVFVFFAATHGVIAKAGKYFLITSDVESASTVEKQALSADELAKLLAALPISNRLVVLDTCYAGAAGDAIARAILNNGASAASSANTLGRDIGVTVLAAATTNEEALEEYKDRHGLFTYMVSTGLAGAADLSNPKHGTVTNDYLAAYVKDELPPIAKNFYQHEQHPTGDTTGPTFLVAVVNPPTVAPAGGQQNPAQLH